MKLLAAIWRYPFNLVVLFGRYMIRIDHDVKMYLKKGRRGS